MTRPRMAIFMIAGLMMSAGAGAAEFKPGEVIVKYRTSQIRNRIQMKTFYSDMKVKDIHRYKGLMSGYEQLILEPGVDVIEAIEALQKDDRVAFAQPNYILHSLPLKQTQVHVNVPCIIPGLFPPGCQDKPDTGADRPKLIAIPEEVSPAVVDPDLDKAYGLRKIHADSAWKVFPGNKNMIVADIDTGIDYNHEDIAFNLWRNANPSEKNDVVGFDFVHNDGLPFDDNMHGTHTAGTIAAVGGNGIGISGVAQRVSLMSVKFLSGEGEGTTSNAIKAIDYAIQHGAKVLSNSWGGPGDADNPALKEVIARAQEKDVLFVAAAGNDGENDDVTPAFPASFDNDNIISVVATDQKARLASFSNYGLKTTHLGAPGVDIYSTVPGNQYSVLSGTSMACPHVAGAAALVWAKNPTWSYKQVKHALLATVDLLPSLAGKTASGGQLNVLSAVRYQQSDDSIQ